MLDLRSITNVTVCHSPQAANKVLGPSRSRDFGDIFVTARGPNSGAGEGFEPQRFAKPRTCVDSAWVFLRMSRPG
jgi:hypothetical protein